MLESRADVLAEFTVNDRGTITDPGKFEGEPLYAPVFYDAFLNGYGEDLGPSGTVVLLETIELDRNQFPELGTAKYVLLTETDQGFVSTELVETEAEAEAIREEYETLDDETDE